MISWLPYREVSVFTTLSVDETRSLLSNTVIKRRFRWFSSDVGQFEGVVSVDGFNINRVIGYRNSFLPMLYGSFIPRNDGGTQVIVKMMLHPVVLVIMLGFLGALLCGAATSILNGYHDLACFGGFFLFGYLLVMGGFNLEANKAAAFIKMVFQ